MWYRSTEVQKYRSTESCITVTWHSNNTTINQSIKHTCQRSHALTSQNIFKNNILFYKQSTSGPLAGSWPSPTGWQRGWDARWITGGPPVAGCHWAYSFILLPASVPTDVPLHWFWLPTSNLMPPLCWPQQHRVGFQSSITGWIVAAGLLFADPPYDFQLFTVNRWM